MHSTQLLAILVLAYLSSAQIDQELFDEIDQAIKNDENVQAKSAIPFHFPPRRCPSHNIIAIDKSSTMSSGFPISKWQKINQYINSPSGLLSQIGNGFVSAYMFDNSIVDFGPQIQLQNPPPTQLPLSIVTPSGIANYNLAIWKAIFLIYYNRYYKTCFNLILSGTPQNYSSSLLNLFYRLSWWVGRFCPFCAKCIYVKEYPFQRIPQSVYYICSRLRARIQVVIANRWPFRIDPKEPEEPEEDSDISGPID